MRERRSDDQSARLRSCVHDVRYRQEGRTDKTAFRTAIEKTDGPDAAGYLDKAETRAAVALLSRSIKMCRRRQSSAISSRKRRTATDEADRGQPALHVWRDMWRFARALKDCRSRASNQAAWTSGFMGRYPCISTWTQGAGGYVCDRSSVNESMTRWFVIHSTLA